SNKKTNSQVADEVIAGKWGVMPDRKKRLEKAGYDYEAVQKEVNKKMS
ncbi:MAG: lysozyme, partial [Bacilli bacterium]